MSKELIVGNYMFSTLEEANVAKMEQEKIDKLNEKLSGAGNDILYKVYVKSIEKNTFRTPVGFDFMNSIRNKLINSKDFDEEMLPIPVNIKSYDTSSAEEKNDRLKKYESDSKKYLSFFRWSLFLNAILVIVVIALFVITSTSKNPNIINYENALVDKYSSWESELSQKDRELREKERNLNQREENLNQMTDNPVNE